MLDKVEGILQNYRKINDVPMSVDTYESAIELMDALRKNDYGILILDIIMPGFTGMQAAQEIRKFNEEIKIIFLTSSKEFAIDSYAVDAYYYLLKPVKEEDLFPLIDKIMLERKARNQVCVIYTPMGIVNIPFAKIECLEVYNKHLVFHLSDGSNKEIRGSMSDYEEAFLSRTEFKKIHRSYILNMDYISSIEPTTIKTYSGKEFPVSRLLVRDIKDQYMNYMFAKD